MDRYRIDKFSDDELVSIHEFMATTGPKALPPGAALTMIQPFRGDVASVFVEEELTIPAGGPRVRPSNKGTGRGAARKYGDFIFYPK